MKRKLLIAITVFFFATSVFAKEREGKYFCGGIGTYPSSGFSLNLRFGMNDWEFGLFATHAIGVVRVVSGPQKILFGLFGPVYRAFPDLNGVGFLGGIGARFPSGHDSLVLRIESFAIASTGFHVDTATDFGIELLF